jgi:hypothetical protein
MAILYVIKNMGFCLRHSSAALSCLIITLSFFALPAFSVPLQNWRAPYYDIAALRGKTTVSPSGLFWDEMTAAPDVFHKSIWPDSASYSINHWTIEPSLAGSASNKKFITGNKTNLHLDLLSDFRYGLLTVRNALDVDQSYKYDPSFVWHKERIAAGRIEEAYAMLGKPEWFVRFGRINRNWGPMPDRSLVLSDHPFSYDALEWMISARFFEFRHLVAAFPLHGSNIDTKDDLRQLNRYFCAHSLNFMAGKWASVGITETVVFGRTGMPDWSYINPFSIYTVINTNQEGGAWGQGGGNLILSLDWRAHPFVENALIWGQLAVDDFQVDDSLPNDKEPAHWGIDVGASYSDFLPIPLKHHAALRYRYLSKWMYTVIPGNTTQGESYTLLGRSLGFPQIDGDEFELSGTVYANNWWTAGIALAFGRQDTGTVSTPWPVDSATRTLGYRTEPSLSQRRFAETAFSVKLNATGYFSDFAELSLHLDNRFVRNKDHIISESFEYDPEIRLTFSCHYSNFFVRLCSRSQHGKAH